MSRQQADNAGEQGEQLEENLEDEKSNRPGDQLDSVGGSDAREHRNGKDTDHPKRVQYAQGFAEDHPAQPGTDKNLGHGPGPASRDTPQSSHSGSGKRSG